MKKMLMSLLCLLMCLSLLACTKSNNDTVSDNRADIIDLEKCEIGYELPTYPNSDFIFKTEKGEIVEISNFKVVLTEKNSIIGEEPINHEFILRRYWVTVTFDGKTNPTLAGKKVGISQSISPGYSSGGSASFKTVVGNDGMFSFMADFCVGRYIYDFTLGEIYFS